MQAFMLMVLPNGSMLISRNTTHFQAKHGALNNEWNLEMCLGLYPNRRRVPIVRTYGGSEGHVLARLS